MLSSSLAVDLQLCDSNVRPFLMILEIIVVSMQNLVLRFLFYGPPWQQEVASVTVVCLYTRRRARFSRPMTTSPICLMDRKTHPDSGNNNGNNNDSL